MKNFRAYPLYIQTFSSTHLNEYVFVSLSNNAQSFSFQNFVYFFFFFYLLSFENSWTRMIPRLCDGSKWSMNIWQETDRNSINRGALLETRIVIDAVLSWQIFQIHVSLLFRFSKKWLHKRWSNMKKRSSIFSIASKCSISNFARPFSISGLIEI